MFEFCENSKIFAPFLSYVPHCEKTCLRGFAHNTGADQPAYQHSLFSAFVIRIVESIICKLSTGERISSDKAGNFPKKDVHFILLK